MHAWGSHLQLQAAAHPVRVNGAIRACSRGWAGQQRNRPAVAGVVVGKTGSALTELSERTKDKAAGQQEQARGGQRPRARAKQPAALITNFRCKMFASPLAETCSRDRAQQIRHSKSKYNRVCKWRRRCRQVSTFSRGYWQSDGAVYRQSESSYTWSFVDSAPRSIYIIATARARAAAAGIQVRRANAANAFVHVPASARSPTRKTEQTSFGKLFSPAVPKKT
jgi:hypothetical protein